MADICPPAAFTKTESLITAAKLRSRYFFGIPLVDAQGNEMDDDTLEYAIQSAITYIEQKLDITIIEQRLVERYDFKANDYAEFNFITLKTRPVIEVLEVKARYPSGENLVVYPKEWYVVEKQAGQLQLSPGVGVYSSNMIQPGNAGNLPLILSSSHGRGYWPHLFEVTYRAGFPADCIPTIFNEMIGMQASFGILDIMGDILSGLGVASESVGIDGASVSKQLAKSGVYSTFSARSAAYQKRLDQYMDVVRKHYNGIPFVVV